MGAALCAMEGALYWRYLRATRTPLPPRPFAKPVRHVPHRTLQRLGWLDAEKDSAFVRFELRKRPGIVRVGCVGDSFTYGAEVGPSDDYPSILQRLFRERGYPQIEVINFGSGWYGFQQSFILWDEVARHFGLDYVLLGPRTFFFGRDTTFDHSSPSTIHFLHARYALEGPGLRLWEVAGGTFEERADAYRRLIPFWRYLRYDRRAPAFLACLLPRGRELRNPFYYRGDIKGELDEVYRRLLLRMGQGRAQIVLGNTEEGIVRLGRGLGEDGIHAARLAMVSAPPYRALNKHASPAGNRLLAEQFFAALTGRPLLSLPIVRLGAAAASGAPAALSPARNLDAYARVVVGLEDGRPWHFAEVGRGMRVKDLPPDFLRARGVRSLLALKAGGQDLAEAVFFSLRADIEEGMPLTLRSPRGESLLGKVSLLRPGLQVGVVDLNGIFGVVNPRFKDMNPVYRALRPIAGDLPGRVFLGGREIFSATGGEDVVLHPLAGRALQVSPPPDLLGATARLRSGQLALRFELGGGGGVTVPLASWERSDLRVSFPSPGLPRPIRRPGQ